MRELTKAEEQVMLILWEMGEALVKEIIVKMPSPKPAYNTVATVVRVLEGKGFVNHKVVGNTHVFYPEISEKEYRNFVFEKIMGSYFDGSYKNLVSFLVKEKNMSIDELNELVKLAEQMKKKKS